jgi:chromosome segregation ATPase
MSEPMTNREVILDRELLRAKARIAELETERDNLLSTWRAAGIKDTERISELETEKQATWNKLIAERETFSELRTAAVQKIAELVSRVAELETLARDIGIERGRDIGIFEAREIALGSRIAELEAERDRLTAEKAEYRAAWKHEHL